LEYILSLYLFIESEQNGDAMPKSYKFPNTFLKIYFHSPLSCVVTKIFVVVLYHV
jgi:hypothetical protein